MPRAGVSASRFDDGWDWIDPEQVSVPAAGAATEGGPAYYDWSVTGDFRERSRPRALRAVPDAAGRPRAVAAGTDERPVRTAPPGRPDRTGRRARPVRTEPLERAVRAAGPVGTLTPVAAPPVLTLDPAVAPAVTGRRTVTITGRGAEGHLYDIPRRPGARPHERAGFKPDRIAMWAVLLGVLMILAAATSAHAALLH